MSYLGANPVVAQVDGYNQAQMDAFLGSQNLIINGAMQVDQRADGVAQTGKTTSGYYAVDRWKFEISSAGTWTVEQGSGMDGFGHSLKVTCTTADASLAAGDFVIVRTFLEGQDLQHIKKGTVDAQKLSLDFLCKSNTTKTFAVELVDADNNRHVGGTLTITSSGVSQKATFTFPEDVTGEFDNDTNKSLELNIWLAAGSTYSSGTTPTTWAAQVNANRAAGAGNLADTVNNYFEITGVQLVPGDTLPPFLHRKYGDVLLDCMRYYWELSGSALYYAFQYNTTHRMLQVPHPVPMRAVPTATIGVNGGTWTQFASDNIQFKQYVSATTSTTLGYYANSVKFNAEL